MQLIQTILTRYFASSFASSLISASVGAQCLIIDINDQFGLPEHGTAEGECYQTGSAHSSAATPFPGIPHRLEG
jgi:hypothetical protein